MSDFIKKPCKHCPFRNDVRPYLHPDRAMQIAYAAQNPYQDFACHKTTEASDEDNGEMIVTPDSKTCAGFLTLRANCGESTPKGFEPSFDIVYEEPDEMVDAYEEEWERKH